VVARLKVVSGVRVGVASAAIVLQGIGRTVTVPAAIEARAATVPVAADPSRWLRKSSWKN
jgi:hypothetical protein